MKPSDDKHASRPIGAPGALSIAVDDVETRRFVLEAASWTPRVIVGRAVAAVLVLGLATGLTRSPLMQAPPSLGWAVAAATGALAALAFLALGPREVAEVHVDGAARSVRVRTRGAHGRLDDAMVCELGDRRATLCLTGGLLASRPPYRALGCSLSWRHPNVPGWTRTPTFVVAGLDRRDELRAFADVLARCLGLRVAVERDTLDELRLAIGHVGKEPPTPPSRGSGYREGPVHARLDLTRAAGFEPPATWVPLPPTGSGELRESLQSHADGLDVALIPSGGLPGRVRGLAVATLALGAAGALGGYVRDGDVLRGLGHGVAAAAAIAAFLSVSASFGAFIEVLVGSAIAVFRGLHGVAGTPRDGRWSRAARRWRIRGHVLEVRGWLFERRYVHEDVETVVVVARERRHRARALGAWREVGVAVRGRFVRLARSREVEGADAGVTPTLDALAITVARALDVPIRSTS
jgi:hypothetical protein